MGQFVNQTSFQFNGAVLSFLSCSARIFDVLMVPPWFAELVSAHCAHRRFRITDRAVLALCRSWGDARLM
jgi:hypothetical protein